MKKLFSPPPRGGIRNSIINLDGVDYWPVHDVVTRFVPIVSQLSACRLTSDEIDKFAHDLRTAYIANRPRLTDKGSVSFVVPTAWTEISSGATICASLTFERLGSIRIAGATTKLTRFEICDADGAPLGSLRSLPFCIQNLRELNHALRANLGARFSPEIFGTKLYTEYMIAGQPSTLPLQLPLCETPDGRPVDLRLVAVDEENPRTARAIFVIDGIPQDEAESLPTIMRYIACEALGADAFSDLADISDSPDGEDLRYRLFCRVEYMVHRQPDRLVECDLAGEKVLLFPTGEKSADGHRIFCLARDAVNGRYSTVYWVRERDLVGCGLAVDLLPREIDFDQDAAASLEGSLPLSAPDIIHVLCNAERWADAEICEDEGRLADEFHRWYVRSLRAALDTKSFAFGFYSSKSQGTQDAVVHPIQAIAPLIDDAGVVRGAFVVRRVIRNGEARLEVPTVLTLAQARRSASVAMGSDIPDWLKNAA